MSLDLLTPVPEACVAQLSRKPKQVLGSQILIHTQEEGFPELKGLAAAIVTVTEKRNAYFSVATYDSTHFREQLYQLFPGNWHLKIADLGNLPDGETVEDTYFALKEICFELRQYNIIPIVIGGSHDLIFPLYESFEKNKQLVNMVSIDSQFDFSKEDELISGRSYMSQVLTKEPHYLNNFTNIGFQSYYCAEEEKDLMEKLYFDAMRLGMVLDDVTDVEPVLRDADIVGIDMKCLSWHAIGDIVNGNPNGIDARTICALARYAGISDRVSLLGLFELPDTPVFDKLLPQIVWYFIEGMNCRFNEYPLRIGDGFLKFNVPMSNMTLTFFKSNNSGRWWMELADEDTLNNKLKSSTLLPCTAQDYEDACKDRMPQRWYNAIKRLQ